MDLYEYQARDIFEAHGLPVLPAAIAQTAEAFDLTTEEARQKELLIIQKLRRHITREQVNL